MGLKCGEEFYSGALAHPTRLRNVGIQLGRKALREMRPAYRARFLGSRQPIHTGGLRSPHGTVRSRDPAKDPKGAPPKKRPSILQHRIPQQKEAEASVQTSPQRCSFL